MRIGQPLWHCPATLMSLSKNEVHVWRAPLDLEKKSLEALERTLSSDERERAQRFFFSRDRRRFISSRGLIRDILRRYLQAEAEELQFSYHVNGKPFLALEFNGKEIDFSLSHSKEVALVAVACGRRIGIDIEFLRRDPSLFKDIEIALSPNEIAMLRSMPENDRHEALLLVWTCKEAYLKGLGTGLLAPLNLLSVLPFSGVPVWVETGTASIDDSGNWRLNRLELGNDYVGALAVERSSADLEFWQWKSM
jgi:4'-phosphopantetheinyl transferase